MRTMKSLLRSIIAGMLWLGFWVGCAWSDIGEMSSGKQYEWWIVPYIAIFVGFTMWVGYRIGRDAERLWGSK